MNHVGNGQLGEGVRRFKRYPATVDSGIPWVGAIPSHWQVKRLKHVVSKIGSGKTPRGGGETYSSEGVPFLRSQNVHFDGLRLDDVVYISDDIDREMATTRVRANDVLLNITGASLGRCCVVPPVAQAANVNQHVCIVRPLPTRITSGFLNACLASNDDVPAPVESFDGGLGLN